MVKRHSRPRSRRGRGELDGCQDCPARLTSDNWSPSNRKYGRYVCRECWNSRQKAYESNIDPEVLKAQKRKNIQAMKERDPIGFQRKNYGYWLKRQYGITLADYDRILALQGGKCAICKGGTKGRGRYHVGHCHSTGLVRGLLCAKCDILLGHADDDTNLLRAAIYYLIDPPA